MSNEARAFALRNVLSELKNVCPQITNNFIFRENGEIVAEDQTTTQAAIINAQEALQELATKAGVIGGIDSVTFSGEEGKATFNRFQDFYVTSVASSEADEGTVNNLTRVMIPTILKFVREINPSQNRTNQILTKTMTESIETNPAPELSKAEPQENQLIVENFGFGSLLKDASLALIDTALIAQWNETYGDNQVTKISLENHVTGKTIVCGFEPFKESKYEGKGIILLSEKTRFALTVQKGTQICVKPVIGNLETISSASNETNNQREESNNGLSKLTSHQEKYSFNTPVSQFIVENMSGVGGFLGNNDFARVDSGIINQWKEFYGGKDILQITVEETVTGRKLTCRFKPIKGADLEGKGVIQLPDKIQQALQTKKGALVVVKPLVEA